ncbi:MAG: reverse transcriptase family protein [Pseudomonadota bacterium]
MLAQGWEVRRLREAFRASWPDDWAAADRLVDWVMQDWTLPYPPDLPWLRDEISAFLDVHRGLPWLPGPTVAAGPAAEPLPPFTGLGLPALASEADLAAWLEITPETLTWFADPTGRAARREARQGHYTQIWLAKRAGGRRLVEAPLPRLKALQRRILRGILDPVPPHPGSFGFTRGRDCRQAARRHAGEAVVICADLSDFFASVPAARVHAIWRCLGYPPPVARALTRLTTTLTPEACIHALPAADRSIWRQRHLPQGAPTSPALANLAAWRLDSRLSALARRAGAAYSRYADDLTFSGDLKSADTMVKTIAEVVGESGFHLNPTKTRIMRAQQRQSVTGIVVNRHLNLPRSEVDWLKAILTNCHRHGPASQNRTGHPAFRAALEGKIGWVAALNPRRGAKLWRLFDQIDWSRP